MRACTECGEWMGDANATCLRCGHTVTVGTGRAVEADAATAGGTAGAVWSPPPAPDARFLTAPPPPNWAPSSAAGWSPGATDRASRPRRVWPKVLGITVLVAVLAIIGFGVLEAIFGNDPPPALDSYMDGSGVMYTTADGQVQVRMPEAPVIRNNSPLVNGITLLERDAIVHHNTYEVAVYEVHGLPPTLTADEMRRQLEGAATNIGSSSGSGWRMEGTTRTTFRGHQAIEASARDSKGAHVEMLFFSKRGSFYGVVARTQRGTNDVLAEMEKSLLIR